HSGNSAGRCWLWGVARTGWRVFLFWRKAPFPAGPFARRHHQRRRALHVLLSLDDQYFARRGTQPAVVAALTDPPLTNLLIPSSSRRPSLLRPSGAWDRLAVSRRRLL